MLGQLVSFHLPSFLDRYEIRLLGFFSRRLFLAVGLVAAECIEGDRVVRAWGIIIIIINSSSSRVNPRSFLSPHPNGRREKLARPTAMGANTAQKARQSSTPRAARARPPDARSRALCRSMGTMSRCGPRTSGPSIASGD